MSDSKHSILNTNDGVVLVFSDARRLLLPLPRPLRLRPLVGLPFNSQKRLPFFWGASPVGQGAAVLRLAKICEEEDPPVPGARF